MGGSYIKMRKNKQTNTKVEYDRNYYKEHKTELSKRQLLKYYSKKSNVPMEDIDEMVKGYGEEETFNLLKKRCIEIKLEKM